MYGGVLPQRFVQLLDEHANRLEPVCDWEFMDDISEAPTLQKRLESVSSLFQYMCTELSLVDGDETDDELENYLSRLPVLQVVMYALNKLGDNRRCPEEARHLINTIRGWNLTEEMLQLENQRLRHQLQEERLQQQISQIAYRPQIPLPRPPQNANPQGIRMPQHPQPAPAALHNLILARSDSNKSDQDTYYRRASAPRQAAGSRRQSKRK